MLSELYVMQIALIPVVGIDQMVERFVGVGYSDGSIKKILLLNCNY